MGVSGRHSEATDEAHQRPATDETDATATATAMLPDAESSDAKLPDAESSDATGAPRSVSSATSLRKDVRRFVAGSLAVIVVALTIGAATARRGDDGTTGDRAGAVEGHATTVGVPGASAGAGAGSAGEVGGVSGGAGAGGQATPESVLRSLDGSWRVTYGAIAGDGAVGRLAGALVAFDDKARAVAVVADPTISVPLGPAVDSLACAAACDLASGHLRISLDAGALRAASIRERPVGCAPANGDASVTVIRSGSRVRQLSATVHDAAGDADGCVQFHYDVSLSPAAASGASGSGSGTAADGAGAGSGGSSSGAGSSGAGSSGGGGGSAGSQAGAPPVAALTGFDGEYDAVVGDVSVLSSSGSLRGASARVTETGFVVSAGDQQAIANVTDGQLTVACFGSTCTVGDFQLLATGKSVVAAQSTTPVAASACGYDAVSRASTVDVERASKAVTGFTSTVTGAFATASGDGCAVVQFQLSLVRES